MAKILYLLTGRRHHYKVMLKYVPDPNRGEVHVTRLVSIGLVDRRLILNEREIKKWLAPEMIEGIPRRLKRNGRLEITEVYYLGWLVPFRGSSFIERVLGLLK